ncbi:Peptidoglycan hydrolase FlgJ [Polaromonas vacuolata]|uniref:Peptidoglycan hydrolase FlgJ n=1 Tax=Polaromonas vacuolata TaxID=37448 RepID=A0A6H2H5I5_9BURK|nr:flagellar assembly peptidoglycan hydrolase FlgJ [Polaromonas vacuolata]QJC55142.1 Peptidoglycan hydrolase FlgJ [Polaromonas vacuolata]
MSSSGFPKPINPTNAAAGALDQALSFDVQGVDALRRTVRNSPQEGMKQASKQFEVMFMQMVLKSMRDATPSDGMLSSQQSKTYTAMLDQQMAQNLSGRGLGLAEAMFTQLNRTVGAGGTAVSQPPPDVALPMPLFNSSSGPALLLPQAKGLQIHASSGSLFPLPLTVPVPLSSPSAQSPPANQPVVNAVDLSFYQTGADPASKPRSSPTGTVDQFVARMLPAAQRASQATGVPPQLIMAQAALESGWGKREPRADDGSQSFNLFGIKADKSWKGAVVETSTTEYVGGVAQKTRASFRAYASYEEGFADYAKFLTSNPRYANVLATRDAEQAAHGLQRAGYATDPAYGGKLVRIMQQMS